MKTLYDKIWDSHVVVAETDAPAILYIDLHLIHEVTTPQAFTGLRKRGLKVRRTDKTFATMDHSIPTSSRSLSGFDEMAANQVRTLAANCAEFGVPLFDLNSPKQGIVHVIGPELGLSQPGSTIVCGDSHTSTHGAFGALAHGIGTSEVEMVLATQCLLQRKSKNFLVQFDGQLQPGVTAKDMILALIGQIGTGGGTGCVFEFAGSAIRALDMDARMTICNMSIEAGARAGVIAPDDRTFEYLAGREFAPKGKDWDDALARWKKLPSDEGAHFDKTVTIDVSALEPMITYGTNPAMSIPISARVPKPENEADAAALKYMALEPGQALAGHPIDVVFIGSCTNSRLSDLRSAARVIRGHKVSSGVRMLVVPGSYEVKRQAEAEGLDRIFKEAGAEWREAGCSMCIAMNGDAVPAGKVSVSTSNRNFEGRQGKGARTLLASPLTAAASAIEGRVADPRRFGTVL
ncbi:MAG: 3-isopropylmalate dehydratase large subunit [Acidobacteria bacterium]|nr:MAG: 3-isopropylmalate dehydratase large subunit [Acidobacteriota bacterium]